MAYTKDLRKQNDAPLGKIEIAPEVIGVIAGLVQVKLKTLLICKVASRQKCAKNSVVL